MQNLAVLYYNFDLGYAGSPVSKNTIMTTVDWIYKIMLAIFIRFVNKYVHIRLLPGLNSFLNNASSPTNTHKRTQRMEDEKGTCSEHLSQNDICRKTQNNMLKKLEISNLDCNRYSTVT